MDSDKIKQLRELTGLGMLACKKALQQCGGNIEQAVEELRKSGAIKAVEKSTRTAAEGLVTVLQSPDGKEIVLLEVNSETDFVARSDPFQAFVAAAAEEALRCGGDLERLRTTLQKEREHLVQQVGENIVLRRCWHKRIDAEVVGWYLHRDRIGVVVRLEGGSAELARDVAIHVAAARPLYVRPGDIPEEVLAKERAIYTAQGERSGKPADIVEKMNRGRLEKFRAENSLLGQPFVKDPAIKMQKLLGSAGAEVLGFVCFSLGEDLAEKAPATQREALDA